MTEQLSVRDRLACIEGLERTARWLNTMAAWLGERGLETEADTVQSAAYASLAACWWISRPLRPPPPPEQWQEPARRAPQQR
jgi:hypothetical protein